MRPRTALRVLPAVVISLLLVLAAGAEARVETGSYRYGADGGIAAYVVDRHGEAWWHWDGEKARRNLQPGQVLPPGVWVLTGGNGRLVLQLPGGHGIVVEENTRLFLPGWGSRGAPAHLLRDADVFRDSGRVHWVGLELGKIWVDVVQRVSRLFQFEVITPSAVAGVRGTFFSVSVDADGTTKVRVVRGKVQVSGRGGSVMVTPDTATTVKSGGAPSDPEREDSGERFVPGHIREALQERLQRGPGAAHRLEGPSKAGIPAAVREKLRERFGRLPHVAARAAAGHIGERLRPGPPQGHPVFGRGGPVLSADDEADEPENKKKSSARPAAANEKGTAVPKGAADKKGGPSNKKGQKGGSKGKQGGEGK